MTISVEGGGVRTLRDALRTCLQIAGGLTEATRQRAVAAARELLGQTGAGIEAVQRKVSERIPPEVQTLADELVSAGKANRDLLVGLVREEVDKAMERLGRLTDELGRVGTVVDALERRVRSLEGDEAAPARGAARPTVEHVPVDADEAGSPVAAAEKAAPRKNVPPAAKKVPPTKKTAPAAGRAPAKKTAPAAKKTAAKKATAGKTTAGKTTAGRTAAKKTPPAKRTAAAATTVLEAAAAAQQTPAKKTAAKKKTAKQATAKKTTAAKKSAAKKTAAPKKAGDE